MTVETLAQPTTSDNTVSVTAAAPQQGKIKSFNDDDGPSFSDVLDILNPLQHIPIVNTIYQHLTGDKEGAVADLVGGLVWGGAIGLGAAMANLVVEDNTGKSVGDNVLALVTGDDDTAVADAAPQQPASKADDGVAGADVPEPVATTDLAPTGATPNAVASAPAATAGYLVFGGPAPTPGAASPSEPQAAGPLPAPLPTSLPGVAAAATASAAPTTASATQSPSDRPVRAGDFLVFGGSSAASTAASTATATQATQPAVQPATQVAAAANAPVALTPDAGTTVASAGAAPQGRTFAAPPRRAAVTPPQSLPPPTTGPAAIPGNARASAANRSGSANNGDWFVNSFNQAMDKYDRAAKLGSDGTQTPTGAQ
jgi:hypothetical protein